jgi:uncharacterized NAD-dependent epimerase/dehydratase family protein
VIPSPDRRFVIIAEGMFGGDASKTARGVIKYSSSPTIAVIDSTKAGQTVGDVIGDVASGGHVDIPIVATLDEALALDPRPNTLVIGVAPAGGKLSPAWRSTIVQALEEGLDVVNGLHMFLGDDPEFRDAAARGSARIYDFRRPPERMEVATGREHLPGKRVILTVGTDCASGKMGVSLELTKAAREAGLSAAMVPTGQTGMMIEGWGVAIDRVAADFLQGTVEWLTEQAEQQADWIVVEGQGSLDLFAYSSVTLALIHAARPHAMVMVHQAGREVHHAFESSGRLAKLRSIEDHVQAHETIASLVDPSKVVAIALNTSFYEDDDEARRVIADYEARTGLPTDDPYRFGPGPLFARIREAVAALEPTPA